jgi:polysaccharide biosynthesis protein PelE
MTQMNPSTSNSIDAIFLSGTETVGAQNRNYTQQHHDIWATNSRHYKQKKGDWAISVAILVILIESLVGAALLLKSLSVAVAMGIHLTLITFLYFRFIARKSSTRPTYDYALLIICTLFLGPFGSIGSLAVILMRGSAASESLFEGKSEYLLATDASSDGLGRAIQQHQVLKKSDLDSDSLGSFSDVLSEGSIENKQAVIALMLAHFNPKFGPMLQRALNDSEPAIRVQAATAVARLETDYLHRLMKLNEQYLLDPSNPSTLLALAHHFDNYALCGLLDHDRATASRSDALSLYRRYRAHLQSESVVNHQIVRLLVRLGRYQEAISSFDVWKYGAPANPALLSWYAEAYFQLKRFDELHSFCAAHREALNSISFEQSTATIPLALWTQRD